MVSAQLGAFFLEKGDLENANYVTLRINFFFILLTDKLNKGNFDLRQN